MRKLFFAFAFLFVTGIAYSEDDIDAKLGKIIERFVALKKEGKLPGLGKDEHGELSTYLLSEHLRKLSSFKEITKSVGDCKEAYIVEVKMQDRKLRYAFRLTNSSAKYISTFAEKNEKWIRLPEKANSKLNP